jgi:hypothetical protein
LILRGTEIAEHLQELSDIWNTESVPAFAGFYLDHPRKAFIQAGNYVASFSRPKPQIQRRMTFSSKDEYITTLVFAIIGEREQVEWQDERTCPPPSHYICMCAGAVHSANNGRVLSKGKGCSIGEPSLATFNRPKCPLERSRQQAISSRPLRKDLESRFNKKLKTNNIMILPTAMRHSRILNCATTASY